jgi:7-cyano-7-deazaguanine synthase in queuosine biosynthesis
MSRAPYIPRTPERKVYVAEPGRERRIGDFQFVLERNLRFSTDRLERSAFSEREPIVCDAMVVAASAEFADAMVKRPEHGWRRKISINVPVYELHQWESPEVRDSLRCALNFVTGDSWDISFRQRRAKLKQSAQPLLPLPVSTKIVLPFSNGMDSRAVAGLLQLNAGGGLLKVHVGSKWRSGSSKTSSSQFFTRVPYTFHDIHRQESSSRSRGFKFAMIGALAAYLTKAKEIAVPESGQGIFGPVLASTGHIYPDYRNHPQFSNLMEQLVEALLHHRVKYVFPRLWSTKGETLAEYQRLTGNSDWAKTVSCWKSARWSSVNGRFRPCGICAACLLRRMSVHAAGVEEKPESYICADLNAEQIGSAVDRNFSKRIEPIRDYGIAAVQHLDSLAEYASDILQPRLNRHARMIAPYVGESLDLAGENLRSLFKRHAAEWRNFLRALSPDSFVRKWSQITP